MVAGKWIEVYESHPDDFTKAMKVNIEL